MFCIFFFKAGERRSYVRWTPVAKQAIKELFRKSIKQMKRPDRNLFEAALQDPRLAGRKLSSLVAYVAYCLKVERAKRGDIFGALRQICFTFI